MAKTTETPRRKPGRPRTIRLLVDQLEQVDATEELKRYSDRGRANRAYAARAMGVLNHHKRLLMDNPKLRGLCSRTGKFHWELLSALGRVKYQAALRVFAEQVCTIEGTVQEKIRLVRQWRQAFDRIITLPEINGTMQGAQAVGRLDEELKDLAQTICQG